MLLVLFAHRHLHLHVVADANGPEKLQGLAHVDGPRPRQLGAEHRGNQRAPPHAVGDHFLETAIPGVFLVHMGGVHIPGHDGEQLDVPVGKLLLENGAVANADFVEGAVFDHFGHGSRFRRVNGVGPMAGAVPRPGGQGRNSSRTGWIDTAQPRANTGRANVVTCLTRWVADHGVDPASETGVGCPFLRAYPVPRPTDLDY